MTRYYLNHNDYDSSCTDHKHRMQCDVKNGKVFWKCYKCNTKGTFSARHFNPERKAVAKVKGQIPRAPDFPWKYRAWLYKYGITQKEIQDYGIYCGLYEFKHMERPQYCVVLPVFTADGQVMQQARFFNKSLPKYLSQYVQDTEHKPLFWGGAASDRLVLCEDMLSAIKVSKLYNTTGIALLGVDLPTNEVNRISTAKPKEVFVFLDNDNHIVKKNQRKIKKVLDTYLSCSVQIVKHDKDPKECTLDELEELLHG